MRSHFHLFSWSSSSFQFSLIHFNSHMPIPSSHNDDPGGLSKCFSGTLRRLLCTGSLPTHPSDDHIPEMISTLEFNNTPPCNDDSVQVGATPGLVARLMGLDSLPDSNRVPSAAPPNSITRSMSLNFMDYFPEIDRAHAVQHPRAMMTSVSFHEIRTSPHQRNRDCFVLFLENIVDEAGETGGRTRKSEMGLGDLKQRKINIKDSSKEKALLKKRNEPKRVSGKPVGSCYRTQGDSCSVSPRKKKKKRRDVPAAAFKGQNPVREASIGSKFAKKNKVDPQHCESHNPSPVSVMDHTDFPVHHATPPGGNSRKTGSKRKKTPRRGANWDYPAPNLVGKSNRTKNQERGTTKKREKKADKEEHCYTEIFSKICRLTEEDMKVEWTQWEARTAEDFEEMCREFEQEILNVVLHQEVVNELA